MALAVSIGCSSSKEKKENEQTAAEVLFQDAEKELKGENYIHAIDLYSELKTKFPYSSLAKTAELRIADAYYLQESFPEAAASYQGFIQLYPKDERVDYAMFRKGLCHSQQSPEVIARDLSKATDAIATFDELIEKYPTSKYVDEAKRERASMFKKLADKENYVGNFYYIREHYLSASIRYDRILKEYPGLGLDEVALYRAGISYARTQQKDLAKQRLNELISRFPQHPLAREAREELQKLN